MFNHILNSSNQQQLFNASVITGNTPLSQIGCNELNNDILANNIDFDDDLSSKRKTKRGILPKNATNIMKQWLFQHIVVCFLC
jgi:hypothetical protein